MHGGPGGGEPSMWEGKSPRSVINPSERIGPVCISRGALAHRDFGTNGGDEGFVLGSPGWVLGWGPLLPAPMQAPAPAALPTWISECQRSKAIAIYSQERQQKRAAEVVALG